VPSSPTPHISIVAMNIGHRAEIHKVANIDKRMALFLGLAFFCVWIVVLDNGLLWTTPRWFQRQYDWMTSDSITPVFLAAGIVALIAAAGSWIFSGNGKRLFQIDQTGVTEERTFGIAHHSWQDFEALERSVGTITLVARPRSGVGKSYDRVKFELANLDLTGPQLEALIAYYRPDLYRVLNRRSVENDGSEETAPAQIEVGQTPLSTRSMSPRVARRA
jgi:hypothetical protein